MRLIKITAIQLILMALLLNCSSSQNINQPQIADHFDKTQYINPQDYGYDLSIKKIEEHPPADSSFVPISVKGGMRQAFGKVIYPPKAQEKDIRGKVILELYVDSTGALQHATVIQSPHKLLVNAALKAARRWSYNPAMLNQTAVNSFIRIPVNFRMQVQDVSVDHIP